MSGPNAEGYFPQHNTEIPRPRPATYKWNETDLDRTTLCPKAQWCEACDGWSELDIYTVQTKTMGVYCTTLCADCVGLNDTPRLSVPAATIRVMEHCGHLGITSDEMDKILNGSDR